MTFIKTGTEDTAAGPVAQMYAEDVAHQGYVANTTQVFAQRPEVLAGSAQLAGAVGTGMDLRRYQLAALSAACALRSTYCAMVHGRVLRDRFYEPETVRRIATGQTHEDLEPPLRAALTVGRPPRPSDHPTAPPAQRRAS